MGFQEDLKEFIRITKDNQRLACIIARREERAKILKAVNAVIIPGALGKPKIEQVFREGAMKMRNTVYKAICALEED